MSAGSGDRREQPAGGIDAVADQAAAGQAVAAPDADPFRCGPSMWQAAWRTSLVLGVAAALAAWSGQSLWWTLLAQTAATGVICLGLALLMGQGGLIPFGQALFSGVGGLVVMHALRALQGLPEAGPIALMLLPLVGLLAGAGAAAVAGALCARQSGLAFAMITLGLGELAHTLAQMFPAWSGGEGGLRGDRVLGAPWMGLDFGSPAQIAGLVIVYTWIAAVLLAAWPRTTWGLLLRAVRDQPERAAGLGHEPSRLRWIAFTCAGACAGLGGGLLALLFEAASAEALSGTRSASLMLFTYMGGTAGLAGPALGAVMLVLATVWLSVWTQAWSLYVGLLFLGMVMFRPEGLGTALARGAARISAGGPIDGSGSALRSVLSMAGTALAIGGAVVVVEMVYHLGLAPDPSAPLRWLGRTIDPRTPGPWAASLAVLGLGIALRQSTRGWRPPRPRPAADPVRGDGGALSPAPATAAETVPVDLQVTSSSSVLVPPPRPGVCAHGSPVLVLDDVHLGFGRTPVLRGASLEVRAGERLALIGPNGAGKTTLFELVCGRLAPATGQVRWADQRIDGWAPPAVARAGLGRSHQVSRLFSRLTVAEHVWCALLARPSEASPAHRAPEVRAWLAALALERRADTPAAALSYAEQRQLEIGLAAAGGASLLLLDEPTAGMSRSETARCVDLIRRLSAGRTLVMVEHDMEVVFDLADRIAVMVDGRVLAIDTPARIRADARVQQAYLGAAWGRPTGDA